MIETDTFSGTVTTGTSGVPQTMMTTMIAAFIPEPTGVKGIVLSFLVAVLVLLAVGGLIWLIEWITGQSLPQKLKLGIAIVLVILVLIWAVTMFV
jgi:hypothetical protein